MQTNTNISNISPSDWMTEQALPLRGGHEHTRGELPKPILKAVVDYIHENLRQDLSLGQLAKQAVLSKACFIRQFKKSMGISPYQYVLQCRVELAQQLLQQRYLSVEAIAVASGFKDQNHLTRTFRRLTETTPSAYRKQHFKDEESQAIA
ncbi:MAG: helix-turn-helix domain-containing protein [Cyanobacteria bacterium J06635_1]